MKKLLTLAVAMVAAVATVLAEEAAKAAPAAPVAVAEEGSDTGFSFDATLDLFSAYVWRGCVYNDEGVWQPAVNFSYKTAEYGVFGLGLWSNFDMKDNNRQVTFGGLNEIDYQFFYGIDLQDFSLEVGHYVYTFPKANGQDYCNSTREVYASVAYNNDIVTPSVTVYYDYDLMEGFYGNVALNKEFALSDQLTLGLDVALGAGDDDYMAYLGTDDAGLMDFTADVYLSYAVTDTVSVGAKLAWMSLVDSDARDVDAYNDKDILWGGLSLGVSL